MLHTVSARLGLALLLTVCWAGLLRGRWPERWTAIAYAVAWVMTIVLEDYRVGHKIQPALFIIDLCLALWLTTLLVVTSRRWVLWATAYAILLVLTHVSAWITPQVHRYAFVTGSLVWSYAMLASFAAGVAWEARSPVTPPGQRLPAPRP